MKPGTKSRKLGLTIPTVNPCNDFIVDYLLRNKIKSDKQILCKAYLYNLAIESVRKYPLPLICQEQLAALEGFGDFFINQVGRLIKRHYTRGRAPTPQEMEEDDEAHFEVLRIKNKELQEKNKYSKMRVDHNRQLDSVSNLNPSTMMSGSQSKTKSYKPKKGTEPFNILEMMLEMGADEHEVTKGAINEVLFNKGKEKIRLWYVLKQKFLDFDFIQVNPNSEDLIKLTKIGKKYIESYDEERRKKKKKVSSDDDISEQNEEDENDNSNDPPPKQTKSKPMVTMLSKMTADLDLKKMLFPKGCKFQSVDLLINNRDPDIEIIEGLLEPYEDLGYEFCDMELATFMWATDGRIIPVLAFRMKRSLFDEEEFKTICLRSAAISCDQIYIIIEEDKRSSQKNNLETKHEEDSEESPPASEENEENVQLLICSARVSGFNVFRTKGLPDTIKVIHQINSLIVRRVQIYDSSELNKRNYKRIKEEEGEENDKEILKNLGTIEKFNKRVTIPYEMSTITGDILRCIPDLSIKAMKCLLQKFPTLAIIQKKTQDSATTKDKRLFLKSYILGEKLMDEPLTTLIQILFYEEY